MLPSKYNEILGEFNDLLTSGEKVVFKTLSIYRTIELDKIKIKLPDAPQGVHNKSDILLLMLLYPLFCLKNVYQYSNSNYKGLLEASKNTFYRFKNNSLIPWRSILYRVVGKLNNQIREQGTEDNESAKCLIIDDTDLPKTGKRIEHAGMIWSHTIRRSILGFKGLFLGLWDSKSFIVLDYSLHKEKGKNSKMPYGLKKKEIKRQYHKKRSEESAGCKREGELLINKIDNAISLIWRARANGVSVEYVLMDSWFVCEKMIRFVIGIGSDILGMVKMGKTTYMYKGRRRSAKAIVSSLKRDGKVRMLKRLHMYATDVIVEMKGVPVRLFFFKNTQRGKWNVLLSTKTDLSATKAYEIYSIRWSIEVFFKEAKKYFGLGKSQSRDFNAQIADISISMIQYNIFSVAKRFTSYETLGALFNETKDTVMELTICKRLWGFILELLAMLADIFDVDLEEVMSRMIELPEQENRFLKIMQKSALVAA
jgi:hypothetical protein